VPTGFALDVLFLEISQTFRPIAEDRELRLVLRPTDLWVVADRAMLSQALSNLVSNAIRYTREGGVLVGARRRGTQVRIDVWDTGIGIAAEHQAQVFDEFFQVGTDPHRANRGLGLGLATVKRLGQIMQMPIELHSRPGRGTVFSLTLPACVPRPPEPVLPASTPTVDLGGLVVLVIDDERAILDGIEWLLQSWGCIVTCAENVEQARAALAASPAPPDLVISDLRLRGGSNGIEVIRQLQAEALTRFDHSPKALLVTGETAPERLREIDGSGVPVLHKPVPPARLREALAATLAGRGAAD
jgi:CheY-like chemotaxis protein/anti-sigma regulatory factor (Ser/Thr protein kinase)